MTATTTPAKPEPPAQAVAADAHWAATREKLRNRNRPVSSLTICDDLDIKKALEDAKFIVRRLEVQLTDSPDDPELKKDMATATASLAQAQEAFDAVAIRLRFQALRRPDLEDLKKAHPPTEEQAEDNFVFNVETFGPELIAAASLDGITVEDARYYLEEWSDGETNALFSAAWSIQSGARMDLGKG